MRSHDYQFFYGAHIRLQLISWMTGVGCVMMAFGCLTASATGRQGLAKGLAGASLITGIAGALARPLANSTGPILRDYRDISDDVRQNQTYQGFVQPLEPNQLPGVSDNATAVSLRPVEWFNWDDVVNKPNEHPHVALVSKSGGGKSTLAEWLAAQVKGFTIAAAPHWEPANLSEDKPLDDFSTADVIVCQGRYFGEDARPYEIKEKFNKKGEVIGEEIIGEPPISITEVLQGAKPTYCQFMRGLVDEMDRRYKLREQGKLDLNSEDTPVLNVILDEFNAVAAGNKYKGMRQCISVLLREARKVGIRLFLLVQSDEVQSLGIAGEGSLRQNLTYIRLSTAAVSHITKIVEKMKNGHPDLEDWQVALSKTLEADRPCTVEDQPATIPHIDLATLKDSNDVDQKDLTEESAKLLDEQDSQSLEGFVLVLKGLKNQGKNKTEIITDILGYRGKRYQEGKILLDSVGFDAL